MLLLLPGLICDARIFAPVIDALPGSRAIDGYGQCNRLDMMAGKILDQAPDRFDLLGHSMGGRVALEIMRLAPRRVRRLALVSTGVHGVDPGEADKRCALTALGRREGFSALVDAWLPPMIGAPARGDRELVAPLEQMCRDQGLERWEAQVAALLSRREAASLLPRIACPTLVMTGALDSWSPPAQHATIAETVPGAVLEIVPQAGHMITHEAPGPFIAAVRRWLATPVEPDTIQGDAR
jgi:pimeloyl-ACP methyl ester carboxylesterase